MEFVHSQTDNCYEDSTSENEKRLNDDQCKTERKMSGKNKQLNNSSNTSRRASFSMTTASEVSPNDSRPTPPQNFDQSESQSEIDVCSFNISLASAKNAPSFVPSA